MAEDTGVPVSEERGKVISGEARIEKKTIKRKVVDFLFSNKLDSIGVYLLHFIVGPSVKDLIYKLGTAALSMALYDNANEPNVGGNYIPGQGYQPGKRDPYSYQAVSVNPQAKPVVASPRIGLEEVSFGSENDALIVLNRMGAQIQRYGMVKVADFYEFSGVSGQEDNWVLNGIGWYTLGQAHPVLCTNGRWIITFPPVQQLR